MISGTSTLPKACTQITRASDALDPGGHDVLLAQLVEHEGAGHARDVGERVVAQDAGRQQHVVERVLPDLPFPGDRRVDQDEAGDRDSEQTDKKYK